MQALLLKDNFQDVFPECDPDAAEGEEELCCSAVEDTTERMELSSQPGPSTTNAVSKKRTRSQLNKKEKEQVVEKLKGVTGAFLLDTVVRQVPEELHMQHYPERAELLASLFDSCGEDLENICTSLAASFIKLYLECSTGREKYGRFQVKWHSFCSKFLLDAPNDIESDWSSLSPPMLWLEMTRSVPKSVRNPVMISVTSAIYGYMLQKASITAKGDDSDSHYTIEREGDEVYLRFGGGALADMFQTRYKEMKSKKPSKYKEKVSQELQVLQWMQMTEKSKLPSSLAYRDRGGMYFPDLALLPFIRSVDTCVREIANDVGFKRYGKNLVAVVTQQVQHNKLLFKEFETFLYSKVEGVHSADKAIVSVYSEFSRKLCNTRVNEFLDTYRQRLATEKGKATLAGQNLRDTLLSQHVNLKTKLK